MNSLSWFIYFIGVSSSINLFSLLVSIISLVVFVCVCISYIINRNDKFNEKEKHIYDEVTGPLYIYWRKVSIIVFSVFVTINILLPDRQTLILIGASEFGERMINSDKGQRILDPSYQLLEMWINKEIESLKNDMLNKAK
jgi:amino acid transporter